MTAKSKTSSATKSSTKTTAASASKSGRTTSRGKPAVSARAKSAAAAAMGADRSRSGRADKKIVAKKSSAPRSRAAGEKTTSKKPGEDQSGLDAALRALYFALDKKALEPVLLDVRDLCSFCNYQLVLSGKSDRQVDAIADGISFGLKGEGIRPLGAESTKGGQWALLDYGDFVVHVFVHSVREHYDLEGLWNDAARVQIDVPKEARIPISEQYS
jgi:ribosome-associated protein